MAHPLSEPSTPASAATLAPASTAVVATPLDAVAALTAAVGNAQTLTSIYEAALNGLREGFGVERASILLFDEDGVMRFKAWRNLSDEYRRTVEGHTPWTPGQATPEPVMVCDVRSDAALARYAETFAREGIVSLAFFPLVASGGVIGKFMLYQAQPTVFSEEQTTAGKAMGFLLGFAVERTRRIHDADREHRRLLFALDAARMGTWDWDMHTQAVRWSSNLERIHGLPPGTFTGAFDSYAREIHPDDRARVMASVERALRDDVDHDVEYRIVAPDGTVRWVHGKGRVERDATGTPVRMSGVCMDISARRRIEDDNQRLFQHTEQLLRAEETLRSRLTTLTDGSFRLLTSLGSSSVEDEVVALAAQVVTADAYAVWRRQGDHWQVAASRGLSETFTATRIADTDRRLPFDRPIVASNLAAAPALTGRLGAYAREGLASLVSVPLSMRGNATGSVVFYYRSAHQPSEGEVRVAVALGHLAAAAISNAELYQEQQRLRRTAEATHRRSTLLADASARLSSLDYEANLRSIAELAVERLCDWCAVDLFGDDGSRRRVAMAHRDAGSTASTDPAPDSTMVVPLQAGSRIFGTISLGSSDEARRFDDADLACATELGRRAAFAIENARLYAEARNANRLKDEFLATLSHELRTPLNVIAGRSHMLTAATDMAAVRQSADAIDRNCRTLSRLVDDLLDVSRMTIGQVRLERQHVDIDSVVSAAVQVVQSSAEAKGVSVHVDAAPNLAVAGDATRIQQIVWNLLSNAVKFTPAGGRIDVTAQGTGRLVTLSVRDSGEGIPPEALPHIFGMFWQAPPHAGRRQNGLGLGLSIARKLAELHGGDVTAESDGPGRGATFTVTLPSAPAL